MPLTERLLHEMMKADNSLSRWVRGAAGIFLSVTILAFPAAPKYNEEPRNGTASGNEFGDRTGGQRVSRDFSALLIAGENQTLHLNTDLGSVRILQLPGAAPPVVRCAAHIETDAHGGAAAQLLDHYAFSARNTAGGVEITGNLPQLSHGTGAAQFWVHFEVYVPASYSVDVYTGTGDIQTSDIGGTATLITEGGNIVAGRIGAGSQRGSGRSSAAHLAAKLQTQGGHIQAEDVLGNLTAFTAGGHINTGTIYGEANLHSGGGHIRAAGIEGTATLVTEGGNITVGKAATFVDVKTGRASLTPIQRRIRDCVLDGRVACHRYRSIHGEAE